MLTLTQSRSPVRLSAKSNLQVRAHLCPSPCCAVAVLTRGAKGRPSEFRPDTVILLCDAAAWRAPMAALQQNQRFMQLFWDLAALKPELQVSAAQSLLHVLEAAQARTLTHPSTTDALQEGGPHPLTGAVHRPRDFSDELDYAVTRLVRGLASSRDGARKGFSLALTEVWPP